MFGLVFSFLGFCFSVVVVLFRVSLLFSSLVRLSFRNSPGLDQDPLFSPPLRGGVGGGGSGTLSIGGLSREIRVSLLLFVFCLSFSVFFLVFPFSLL